ncbi:MAG TPA: hypothetical protein VIW70_03680 [Rubrivivax sp.]
MRTTRPTCLNLIAAAFATLALALALASAHGAPRSGGKNTRVTQDRD